jgi:crotonobetainyl-CoA:carnitine CoA-transferase CaiB-like acyl-CoA transferase
MDHSVAGHVRVPAHPAKYSRSPIADGTFATLLPPPMLGEHTEETLVNLLGMSTEDVDNLEALGIVSCWRGSSTVDTAQRAA